MLHTPISIRRSVHACGDSVNPTTTVNFASEFRVHPNQRIKRRGVRGGAHSIEDFLVFGVFVGFGGYPFACGSASLARRVNTGSIGAEKDADGIVKIKPKSWLPRAGVGIVESDWHGTLHASGQCLRISAISEGRYSAFVAVSVK